jgi:hypothetical protein
MSLHDNGSTCYEIAAVTGRSPSAVRRFAAVRGVLVTRSCAIARFAIPISLEARDALRRLASDHGATCAADLLVFALEKDAAGARRTLRTARR